MISVAATTTRSFGIDGCLAANLSLIWVDEALYKTPSRHPRYRFTLAHEIGHWYLHKRLFKAGQFESPAEWITFLDRLQERDRSWYETQAYWFGGLVLVQKEPLAVNIDKVFDLGVEHGVELDFEFEPDVDRAANWICRRFDVSADVIKKRGKYDGYWD